MGAEQSGSKSVNVIQCPKPYDKPWTEPEDKPWEKWDPWPNPPGRKRIIRVPPVRKRFVRAPPDDNPSEWIKKWLPKPDPDFNPNDYVLWHDPVAARLKKNRENRGVLSEKRGPIGRPPKQWEKQMDKAWDTYGKHGLGKVGQ